ncbi:MAG: hypothetical protein IPL46_22365 [Saprospiraceae bacterium]|nr:hypothetical protein [Saprospiraceae bacterium]
MKYSTNLEVEKSIPSPFVWIILTISFFSFTPDKSLDLVFNPNAEFCAVGSTFLEPAFQSSPYSDSIKWTPPNEDVFSGFTLPIDSFEVVQVTGLPSGLTFQCDDPNFNCSWVANPPASVAHIILNGNPDNATASKYKVKIEVRYWATVFGQPISLTKTDSSLFIFLCPFQNNSTQLEVVELDAVLSLGNVPSSGYYFGLGTVHGSGTISNPKNVLFLSNNDVILKTQFQVDAGAQFLAGTCPE